MLKSFVLIIWFQSEHDVKQIYLSKQIEWYELFLNFYIKTRGIVKSLQRLNRA